ncbi:YcnI family protein [Longispora albida]|uniref:YcnI family protein n=1 Tax=Longispora albida TaxID=203523 RepID=UPI0003613518|nr:YcnI family protein [Longispora albida]
MRKLRVLLAGLGAAAVVLATAAPAAAHVTVDGQAKKGGYARVVFRVPNESDTASTVKLEVNLPESQPMSSVRTQPVPGWTAELVKTKLATPLESHGRKITEAVTKITWTATSEDAQIKPGQFQEFPVSVGALPQADQMVFKAIQTYSDGNVVRWIEEKTGAEEPAKPAPVLKLVSDTAPAPAAAAKSADAKDEKSDGVSLVVGYGGLVAGLLALGLAAAAYARAGKKTAQ